MTDPAPELVAAATSWLRRKDTTAIRGLLPYPDTFKNHEDQNLLRGLQRVFFDSNGDRLTPEEVSDALVHRGLVKEDRRLRDVFEAIPEDDEPQGARSPEEANPLPADAFPEDPHPAVFHGLAGEFVRIVEPHSEAHPMALLTSMHSAVGSLVGRNVYAQVEGDRHYANLFCVLVGATSHGRKGTSLGRALSVLDGTDDYWNTDCVKSGLSSGEGLIFHVRDEVLDEKGSVKDSGVADKRLLVIEKEFGGVLKVLAREGNILSAVVRDAWDSGDLRNLVKNSPLAATGAHVSILGHITGDELRKGMREVEARNGFANRFLWVAVRRSRLLPNGGALRDEDLAEIRERVRRVTAYAKVPRRIDRDKDASALWREVYPKLTEDHPGVLGALTARSEAQVLRLSLLYAILDEAPCIRRVHLEAALAFWEYALDSTRWAFGIRSGNPLADDLLDALADAPDGLLKTELWDAVGRHATRTEMDEARTLLLSSGLIMVTRDQGDKGRPAERWLLNPGMVRKKRKKGGRGAFLRFFRTPQGSGSASLDDDEGHLPQDPGQDLDATGEPIPTDGAPDTGEEVAWSL